MPNLNFQPEGILVTLPARFFAEYNFITYGREMKAMEKEDTTMLWYRCMKNLPRVEVLYVYTVYGGYVQHRTLLVQKEYNVTRTFWRPEGGQRVFQNSNFVVQGGPLVWAPKKQFPMKGFQGFRYTEKLF